MSIYTYSLLYTCIYIYMIYIYIICITIYNLYTYKLKHQIRKEGRQEGSNEETKTPPPLAQSALDPSFWTFIPKYLKYTLVDNTEHQNAWFGKRK